MILVVSEWDWRCVGKCIHLSHIRVSVREELDSTLKYAIL